MDTAFDGAAFARTTLEAGFTTVQDVGGINDSVFGLRDAIARGAVTGPRMRAAGQSISVTGGHGDVNGYSSPVMKLFTGTNVCNGADDCRRAVRQQVKEGADVIKITVSCRTRPPDWSSNLRRTSLSPLSRRHMRWGDR